LVGGQQFLDSMRMGSPGKPLQSFSRAAILNGLKEKIAPGPRPRAM
jgi:hypothetical protein